MTSSPTPENATHAPEMTQEQMLDELAQMSRGTLDERMGIRVLEASPERVVATMPVEGNTQPFGLLHGGANVVVAESVGSIGREHGRRAGTIRRRARHQRDASPFREERHRDGDRDGAVDRAHPRGVRRRHHRR